MVQEDFDAFMVEFRRMTAALQRFKQSPEEAHLKADAFFQTLRKFPLSLVIAKGDQWRDTQSKMPTPAEWAGTIVVQGQELQVLSDTDAAIWLEAERRHWESWPCACPECLAAGVDKLPLRFVPETTADDRDRHVQLGTRVVTAGRWIHGFDLKRLYAARAAFVEGGGTLPRSTERRERHSEGLRALLEKKTVLAGKQEASR